MENKRLVYSNMRLEQENDDLARELVSSKIMLRKQLDALEDVNDSLRKEVKNLISTNCELEEDGKRLIDEVTLLKENFRTEVDKSEKEIARNLKIIHDYKSITSQLSQRLETESDKNKQLINELINTVKDCPTCYGKVVNVKRLHENNFNGADSPDGVNDQSGDNFNDNHTRDSGKNDSNNVESKIRELELELAQTKLALVEAECVNQVSLVCLTNISTTNLIRLQDLVHDLNDAQNQLKASKGSNWINKTLTTIREVKAAASNKRASTSGPTKDDHHHNSNNGDSNFPGPSGLSSSRVHTPGTPGSSTSSSMTASSRFLSRENSRDFS